MNDDAHAAFYRAFEDKYRGPRAVVRSRLRVFLPLVEPLGRFCGSDQAVDLGCGRGEWLELLQEAGFDPQGVDLDAAMLAGCRERKLKVHVGDAVTFLKGLPESSQAVVSGFHLAEHLQFAALCMLVAEALRVLVPGGVLILETPNPENILVGASRFYIDPTHQRPLPAELLSFLPEYYGFKTVNVLRLQESAELSGRDVPTLIEVLGGASPDYAIVAQKATDDQRVALDSAAFEPHRGLSLETLAQRHEARGAGHEAAVAALEARAVALEAGAVALEAGAVALEARTVALEAGAVALEARSVEQGANVRRVEAALDSIYRSRSWRMTRPLRWLGNQVRRLRDRGAAGGARTSPEGDSDRESDGK
jgi:SAM-dependent methyltransferase